MGDALLSHAVNRLTKRLSAESFVHDPSVISYAKCFPGFNASFVDQYFTKTKL